MIRLVVLAALSALYSTVVVAQVNADLRGTVVDSAGHAIVGARIALSQTTRRVVSDDAGQFGFRAVAVGSHALTVQRIGYAPIQVVVDVTEKGAVVTIVMAAIPQVLDSVRVLEKTEPNRFSAIVVDDANTPLPDVAVTIEGVSNTLRTDARGRFVSPKQMHGTVVIRLRKMGYRAYLGSIRMLATRDDTLRIPRLSQALSAVEINEASGFGRDTFAYRELDQRQRWKGAQAAVVSREELDQQGRVDLCTALPFTPTGSRYNVRCGACIILNGQGRTLMPARAYYADQVELIEYFPQRSDLSNSLAARGCVGATLVIWLRKDAPTKP